MTSTTSRAPISTPTITPPPPPPPSTHRQQRQTQQHQPRTSALDQRLTVSPAIVDELLLVCGVLTTTDDAGNVIPNQDCWNWLQDLQRCLRRDDDYYRPVSLLLASWRVVPHQLLPLLTGCRYDEPLVTTVCKLLVLLTKPPAPGTVAALAARGGRAKEDIAVRRQQNKIRANALQQAKVLQSYKRCVVEAQVWPVLTQLLAAPLRARRRTPQQHLVIELVLHLLRNLLQADSVGNNNVTESLQAAELHNQLIAVLQKEMVLDIVLVLASQLEDRENAPYNLLVLEILHALVRNHHHHHNTPTPARNLSQLRNRERLQTVLTATSGARHGNFGGTLVVKRGTTVTTTTAHEQFGSTTANNNNNTVRAGPKARRRKDAFVVSTVQPRATTRVDLDPFLARLVHRDCFGPLMKSLKQEFRRDSARLEQGDQVLFFDLCAFLAGYRRRQQHGRTSASLGPFLFTLDLFSFQLVLNAIDDFHDHNRFDGPLQSAVAWWSEMMHMLVALYHSPEETERVMAYGLMDSLFYSREEPLDRLPRVLARWKPGTLPREYGGHVAEVCHVTMKLLETHAKKVATLVDPDGRRHRPRKEEGPQDTLVRLQRSAADFDVQSYFVRRIGTNHAVLLYTELLAQYATNSVTLNHRVVTFFKRLARVKLAVPEPRDDDMAPNPLAPTTATSLEPMLFNFRLLRVIDTIVNDRSIRKSSEFDLVRKFGVDWMSKFSAAAEQNPLVFVEALFVHPFPHRHCERLNSCYVSEELRMLVDREMLLEGHARLEERRHHSDDDDDESSDEELEFDDCGITQPTTTKVSLSEDEDDGWIKSRAARPTKKRAIGDSDSEDDQPASKKNKNVGTENNSNEAKRFGGNSASKESDSEDDQQDSEDNKIVHPENASNAAKPCDGQSVSKDSDSEDDQPESAENKQASPEKGSDVARPSLEVSDSDSDGEDDVALAKSGEDNQVGDSQRDDTKKDETDDSSPADSAAIKTTRSILSDKENVKNNPSGEEKVE